MVKVLVVDDDKMARQGLILSIDWEKFGMKVVGQAQNGLKALQFLDENPVDLVLTDLAMPVMSGIELMKNARQKHRSVLFAVLTFHEDFEYTREALRLGAIDYVSKLQLEKENLDAVLSRIRDRFAGEASGGEQNAGQAGENSAVVFFAVGVSSENPTQTARLSEVGAVVVEVGKGVYLWRTDLNSEQRGAWREFSQTRGSLPGWFLVRLQGLLGEKWPRVEHLLREYQANALFYDFRPGTGIQEMSLEALEKAVLSTADLSPEAKTDLTAMEWMHNAEVFARVTADLRAARLPFVNLIRLLVHLESEWNRVYGKLAAHSFELSESFWVWQDVEDWMGGIRDFTYSTLQVRPQSREAKAGALRALRIIQMEYASPLHAEGIARRVNMSRSHFCSSFKEVVGTSFLDHLSSVRLEKAKELLTNFDLPVYQVAEQSGYTDERYFSRLFRKATGVLPSEYRKTAAK